MTVNFTHGNSVCPVCSLRDASTHYAYITVTCRIQQKKVSICGECAENLFKGVVVLEPKDG